MDGGEFGVHVRRTLPRVRAYVSGKVPPDEVDDVVQATFMSLWTMVQRPEHQELDLEKATGLVIWIADKRIADLWRSRYRHEARVDALRRNMIGLDVPSASDEVIAGLAPAWLHELSDDALDLLRRVVDGATVTEIAEQLGITPNAVSSRLTRLRAKIPVLLEKEAAGDRD